MEVHEDILAFSLGNPQDLAETAPVEERMVVAVLLLKRAEEEQLLWHKRGWRPLLWRLLLVNLDAPGTTPRSPASYGP